MVLGIDGCRGGWLVASLDDDGLQCFAVRELMEILGELRDAEQTFIDMPMGLGSPQRPRTIESSMRRLLGPTQKSSVFSPPTRQAVYCDSYEEAKAVNLKLTGKSISIQAWNITPKIKELDVLLREYPEVRSSIYEAHPEICFNALKGDFTLHKKRSVSGRQERIEILESFIAGASELVTQARSVIHSSIAAHDDIIDAIGLCVSANNSTRHARVLITDSNSLDEHDIPMRVAYPDPEFRSS